MYREVGESAEFKRFYEDDDTIRGYASDAQAHPPRFTATIELSQREKWYAGIPTVAQKLCALEFEP